MSGKPRDTFYKTPDMPSEIKARMEQRKREELEVLEKADSEGRKLGAIYAPTHSRPKTGGTSSGNNPTVTPLTDTTDPTGGGTERPISTPQPADTPKITVKPTPATAPTRRVDPVPDPNEGSKRKGKKGDE